MIRDVAKTTADATILGVIGYGCVELMQEGISAFRAGKWSYFVKEPHVFKHIDALNSFKIGTICSLFVIVDFAARQALKLIPSINIHEPASILGRLAVSVIVTSAIATAFGTVATANMAIGLIGLAIAIYSLVQRIAEKFNHARYTSINKDGFIVIPT